VVLAGAPLPFSISKEPTMQPINREIITATLSYVDENGWRISITDNSISSLISLAFKVSKSSVAYVTSINDEGALRVLCYKYGAYLGTTDVLNNNSICDLCGKPSSDSDGIHSECARMENARADIEDAARIDSDEDMAEAQLCGGIK
jgi:hypothetical protein